MAFTPQAVACGCVCHLIGGVVGDPPLHLVTQNGMAFTPRAVAHGRVCRRIGGVVGDPPPHEQWLTVVSSMAHVRW